MRAEFVKGGMSGQPEGTILLTMNTGEVIQLNPKNKTYWKSTMTDMAAMMQSLGMQPEVTVTPARETATVAGVQATTIGLSGQAFRCRFHPRCSPRCRRASRRRSS